MKDALTTKKAVIGLLVAVTLVLPLYAESNVNEQRFTFPASVNVTPPVDDGNMTIGVDPGHNLDFGIVMAKNDVRKFVNISAPQKTLMTIQADGNISALLSFDADHYFQGTKEIEIAINTTEDDAGYFAGDVTMIAQTADTRWTQRWLALKSRLY